MIRTKTVELTTIPAIAFRQKLPSGGSGITILRSDSKQPGIASISRTSGAPIPTVQTNAELFPPEAFKEAMKLTNGLPYRKQPAAKADEKKLLKAVKDTPELKEEEVIIDSEEYQKVIDRYADKTGKLSHELMNKDFIRFAKQSSIVRGMLADKKPEAAIRNYVISHKIKGITGNDKLSSKELKKIVEMLDEVSPKGVYKELNSEIRKMIGKDRKA